MEKENLKILLVDDEKDILESLKTHLELDGFNVTAANSAIRALELIQDNIFHVILTDINMPLLDGLDLLESIKNVRGETLVIMVTAFTSMDKVWRSRIHGAFDYILKPFKDMSEIDNVVQRAMTHLDRWNTIVQQTKNFMEDTPA